MSEDLSQITCYRPNVQSTIVEKTSAEWYQTTITQQEQINPDSGTDWRDITLPQSSIFN